MRSCLTRLNRRGRIAPQKNMEMDKKISSIYILNNDESDGYECIYLRDSESKPNTTWGYGYIEGTGGASLSNKTIHGKICHSSHWSNIKSRAVITYGSKEKEAKNHKKIFNLSPWCYWGKRATDGFGTQKPPPSCQRGVDRFIE